VTRDDIIRLARESGGADITSHGWTSWVGVHSTEFLERFAALVAAAEQRPTSDVTEAVTKTVIEVEKLLCEKIGRQWQPSGMSIQTLVDELAALVAAAEREACREIAFRMAHSDEDAVDVSHAIRARGEQEQPR
jgi:nitrogen fixation/metabolism regulation signal transduction histidine kinase